MARGKQATLAARRRAESAHEIIDRLTSELAEAKLRARQAEQRAARLEGIEALLTSASAKNDEMLCAALAKLAWWKAVADADYKRRFDAIGEMLHKVAADVNELPRLAPFEDRRQFVETRYPAIMAAITAGQSAKVDPRRPVRYPKTTPSAKRLNDEQLHRFQRLAGERGILESAPDRDIADVWVDLLDAHQAGFTPQEVIEFALR